MYYRGIHSPYRDMSMNRHHQYLLRIVFICLVVSFAGFRLWQTVEARGRTAHGHYDRAYLRQAVDNDTETPAPADTETPVPEATETPVAVDTETPTTGDAEATPTKDAEATPTEDAEATPTGDIEATPTEDAEAKIGRAHV